MKKGEGVFQRNTFSFQTILVSPTICQILTNSVIRERPVINKIVLPDS